MAKDIDENSTINDSSVVLILVMLITVALRRLQ